MKTLEFTGGALVILDQTRLPDKEVYLPLTTPDRVREAICALRVRGAPAIGVAAAYGLYLGARALDRLTPETARGVAERLASARPTAVNLTWALERMMRALEAHPGAPREALERRLLEEARAIEAEDKAACRAIGEHGLSLLRPDMGVLTHCNAGKLATAGIGTALAPLYLAHEKGYNLRVYADETRPLLQGARLTVYELARAGLDVTLICDGMAAAMMKAGRIGAVFTGADRIARNGDAANKTGTLGLAVLARHFGVPFYICAPTSTLDAACPDGGAIVIEERGAEEVAPRGYGETPVRVRNPAFDVTDAALIDAIVTERGILRPPYRL
ncbi:MAG: S-methyl-5-thioribose-1-phosphate isomerase [Oscillospiraceae bacterium]|nr:S-methyl-5-thioribose-1-phosphate isomerase [Oscillospiraceae bacterium]